jgi:hypothetical protein
VSDLQTVSAEELAILEPLGERRTVEVDDVLYRAGDPIYDLYVVISGQVESSQAVKNLGFFQPYEAGKPKNLKSWGGKWNGARIGTVAKRIRRGSAPTGNEAWTALREALRDPNTSREVWLVMCNGPSKSKLVDEAKKEVPRAELVQMLYSLQATWTTATSVGTRLRVFSTD